MTDIQETVDELRFILQREVIEDRPELWVLVARYSALCHDVNDRLRRCEKRLRQGLRAEAIHLADEEPNLLDAVATLDFAERSQLQDVCDMYFHDPAEPLLLDIAATLNEAYALQEPLQKLLDQHRVLALGRRPLPERLGVLRELAEVDATTPHWGEDVADMERARLSEMEAESRAAAAAGDVATLRKLTEEVKYGAWQTEIPASLLRNLRARGEQTARKQAHAALQELSSELHAAFSALDGVSARRLRDEWKRHQQIAQLPADDPICVDVAPVLAWLDDEDERIGAEAIYTASVRAIEQALADDEVSLDKLMRLSFQVEQRNRSLPDALGRRFRNRVQTLQLKESRRRKLIYSGAAAAFLAGAAMLGMIAYSVQNAESNRRLVAALEDLITEGKLTEARRLADANATSTAESWLAAQKKLVDAEQTEHDRLLQFNTEMEAMQSLTSSAHAESALQKARSLARTEEEKIAVGKWENTWKGRIREETAKLEQEFRQILAAAAESLQAIDHASASNRSFDVNHLRTLIEEAVPHFVKLNVAKGRVAKELSSQAVLLESRLEASRKHLADLVRKNEMLDKLTRSSMMPLGEVWQPQDIAAYEGILREYVTAFPQDPRSSAFKKAAESCPLKEAYAEQELLHRWKTLYPANEREIETRLRDIRSFATDYPHSPDVALLQKYEVWLNSVLHRYSEDGDPDEGALKRLDKLFNGRFIKDGHIISDRAGHTFYLTEELVVADGTNIMGFKYFIGFNNEKSDGSWKRANFTASKSAPPPQQELAKKVRSDRDKNQPNMTGWNEFFLNLSHTLLKSDELDPFLQYILMYKVLEFAAQGDSFLEEELAAVLARLNDDRIDRSVAWVNPFDKSSSEARKNAKELLEHLPPLEPLFKHAADRRSKFEHELFTARFSIGWLERTGQGKWLCRTQWTPSDGYELKVVSRGDAHGQRSWQTVGQIANAELQIDSTVAQMAGEASVVFAARIPDSQKTAQLP